MSETKFIDVDVLVVGANGAGCAAAIAAARSGASVVLLEATQVLGGMNANGTYGFDCAAPQALSGIAEEAAERVRDHYRRIGLNDPVQSNRADLVWESHVMAQVWHEFVSEFPSIRALTRAVPVGVHAAGDLIQEVYWQHASDCMGNLDSANNAVQVVRPRIVIDTSYEGDVSAWAGASCRIGREPRTALEPHAGRIFSNNVTPLENGTLAHTVLDGSTGEGDDGIAAFAYRLQCRFYDDTTPTAIHRIKTPPADYDPSRYEWKPLSHRADGTPVYFNLLSLMVNGKVSLNRMARGNNLVGPNREYILAHPRDRKELRQKFIDLAVGYLYYIQTEGGMPELGLADDEYLDNGNMPYQIYVREGRRIEGEYTLTEADVTPYITGDGTRPPRKLDAVGLGDMSFESQQTTDATPDGYPYPDGWIINRVTRVPYQIPYGCMLPRGVSNLLSAGPISSTHIAWSAARCEAARLSLGIAAGVAAGLALKDNCSPAQVPVDAIQAELVRRGGKLTFFADVETAHPQFAAIQWAALRGYLPVDPAWCFEPDHPISWTELVKATVMCLGLPVSVSGVHFEGIDQTHPAFKYIESVYDLGTRVGLDIFDARKLVSEDQMKDFLRLFPRFKLIGFQANQAVNSAKLGRYLDAVDLALARSGLPVVDTSVIDLMANDRLPSRGEMCAYLQRIWRRYNHGFARRDERLALHTSALV
jgi:FAD dependent oxidoreductase